jgi:hypothetical protein
MLITYYLLLLVLIIILILRINIRQKSNSYKAIYPLKPKDCYQKGSDIDKKTLDYSKAVEVQYRKIYFFKQGETRYLFRTVNKFNSFSDYKAFVKRVKRNNGYTKCKSYRITKQEADKLISKTFIHKLNFNYYD